MIAIDYRAVPCEELKLNEYEVAKRLHTEKGYESAEVDFCFKELKKAAAPKFSGVRVSVSYGGEGVIDLGFGRFKSCTLEKNLQGCAEAFIFAATLGHGVDRLLNQLSCISPARHFITDALASAMAEALADKTEILVKGDALCRPRFSPGFGDLGLELQPRLLNLLNAQRLLGITTNNSYMMTPMKSVTAIMGIKNE